MNAATILTPLIGIFVILLILAISLNTEQSTTIQKQKNHTKTATTPMKIETLPKLSHSERNELIENTQNMVRTHPKQVAATIRNWLNQTTPI
ncbi:MAG: hypothetical protein H3C43_03170 [Leptonema sp. (in: Bacteria)]|nr:hypothetical protein [Leptonema sp. (in: bacteria)]